MDKPYRHIVLQPQDEDLAGKSIGELEAIIREDKQHILRFKLLRHSHPDNANYRYRHDYHCKRILHCMKEIEQRIKDREQKAKNKPPKQQKRSKRVRHKD